MRGFFFYMAYPFIYLIALLPFPIIYLLSDVCYVFLSITGYRSAVVLTNLRNSFPEKAQSEIISIKKSYYRYLCDLMLETLKTMHMTELQARERCIFHSQQWLEDLYKQQQSFIIVMGHYGNWEWAGPSFTLNTSYQLVVIYRPLSNAYFERMFCGMRTKFGTDITKENDVLRDMVSRRKTITATAFIADQTASSHTAHWMTFLHQDTLVHKGPEKLAVKFKYPVVFMNVQRVKRGHYSVTPELLFEHSEDTVEGEISEKFMQRLEVSINADPSIWLWSHKRWKHTRPTG